MGFSGLLTFFGQRSRLKASAIYFIGLVMIVVVHLSFLGTLVQGLGLFVIFRGYLSAIYGWVCRIPYIGKYLRKFSYNRRKLQTAGQVRSAGLGPFRHLIVFLTVYCSRIIISNAAAAIAVPGCITGGASQPPAQLRH